ncbi:MAG: hypothetical protein WA843_00795 [Candidatus Saccharimonadales bacterium]
MGKPTFNFQKFENLLWSQVKHLPADLKFLVINPSGSAVLHYIWYENGRMRGSGGLPSLKVPMSISSTSSEIELRGGILTAGTIFELMVEQLVYVKIRLYDATTTRNRKDAEALKNFVSKNFGQRLDYLKKTSIIDPKLYRQTTDFMNFRNAVAHSFTLQNLKYGTVDIRQDTWKDVRETLRDDFDRLWAQWIVVYEAVQQQIIFYVTDIIRRQQQKTDIIYKPAIGFGENPILDIRDIANLQVFYQR